MDRPSTAATYEMHRLHRASEPEVLAGLLPKACVTAEERVRILGFGSSLLADLRSAQATGWVNKFLHEYRLDTNEGIALLSLAEAFLRVPDAETADALVADKLGDADWATHAGRSASTLVNAGTWSLVLGQSLLGERTESGVLRRLLARAGEPVVRQAVGHAMRMMGQVFVMGRSIDEAARRMTRPDYAGFTASFDMLGEAARSFTDAERYRRSYADAIATLGRARGGGHSISVKLSALHPRYEVAQWDRCVPALTHTLASLAKAAAAAGIALTVDAEESERLEMSLAIIADVAGRASLSGWDGLGMAVQAYGKRAAPVVAWADELGHRTHRTIAVRLVKGAYWDTEIKRTQEAGLADYALFTRKASTDVSYLAVAHDMLGARNVAPAFATHNALTVATILEWAGARHDFEFQRLHGMGEGLYERLVRERDYRCRVYAPVGGHRDLLAYLVRRLLENGANSSFVHQLADETLSDADLLADPVEAVAAHYGARHANIVLPPDLFAGRRNSAGLDLADREVLAATVAAVADARRLVDTFDQGPTAQQAVDTAHAGFATWSRTPLEARCAILERVADLLETHRTQLMALLVDEARKTLPDALGEVREAVDFCRYYAVEARRTLGPVELPGPTGERNVLRHEGRGVWACIAPWNFPLAIFLGQIVAALVAGNCVVAKPAPQTPRIARYAVRLAYAAGVPESALQMLSGGADRGADLVADVRVAGVAFTGSTATAKRIARSLVADDDRALVPLIAETGGINAMIVDSTALTEQVVADVVASAFASAGQRCSALRLLLVQAEVAEPTLAMLGGAMDALILGDPGDPATDVGPVIDDAAYQRLMAYREARRAHWVHTCERAPDALPNAIVPPTIIRLDRIEDLTQEWFGPILHVATWAAGTLDATVARVNAKGYGLTMGLHSRIARSAAAVEATARVGNFYVNRSMIGAVVGSQPFGGEGRSGTGPKAGGPHYLPRFAVERVTSTDTTSAGGNATLLSLDEAR